MNKNYLKLTNIILGLWFLLLILSAILNSIVFSYPNWFGTKFENSKDSQVLFGLFSYCFFLSETINSFNHSQNSFEKIKCYSSFIGQNGFSNIYFKISSYLILIATVLSFFCVSICFLKKFLQKQKIILINSIGHAIIGSCMLLGCLIYPIGWSDIRIKELCYSKSYSNGKCELKWTFLLGIVQSISSIFLVMVGIVLRKKFQLLSSNSQSSKQIEPNEIKEENSIKTKDYGFSFN
ncbi:unnamed protein product [Brachionus calyciflorus]|uniref:Uncharacterized protein n=1 Tax=Brachionus calyciflorus TaxID=104777 RepID=A0A814ERZ6_9BILA|nr:unnamed protein product [Brachionus calyciflorus]